MINYFMYVQLLSMHGLSNAIYPMSIHAFNDVPKHCDQIQVKQNI